MPFHKIGFHALWYLDLLCQQLLCSFKPNNKAVWFLFCLNLVCIMFHSRMSRPSSEPSKKEMLPPSLVSSSSSSSQKPAKPAQKRPRQEDPGGQDPPKSASSNKGSHRDPSASKHRKAEGKVSGSSTEHKVRRDTVVSERGHVGRSMLQ